MAYSIRFWGARGSIPTPGAETTRYGGNTPCVAVEQTGADGDSLVILDAGTGIRLLGQRLVDEGNGPLKVDLILSHTHWDHIQGIPFFAPFFGEGNEVRIWGSKQADVGLDVILRQQMHPVVFPVPLERLAAELKVEHVEPGEFEVDGFRVAAVRLRHPGNTLGYRLTPTSGGATMAYVTDNELGSGGDYDVGPRWRSELVAFLDGVDVLIHDAMYAPGDLGQHRGWGHSSTLEAVHLAAEAQVGQLVLFHHRPEHDDATMDTLLEAARAEAAGTGRGLDVIAATEGMQLTL
jgi:phosphoribosyl 1,2-cyclic phosphodiesterase